MGLSIWAFSNLTPIGPKDQIPDDRDYRSFYDNPDFPSRADGIDCALGYDSVEGSPSGEFDCGYSTWSGFRNGLAQLAGFASQNAVWVQNNPTGRFVELINFSDCEGTLGPVVCKKLNRDFIAMADKALAYKALAYKEQFGERWFDQYQRVAELFKIVAEGPNGAMKFG